MNESAARETWQEIADVVDRLATIAKTSTDVHRFYRYAIDQIVPASAAVAGAAWLQHPSGELVSAHELGLETLAVATLAHLPERSQAVAQLGSSKAWPPSAKNGGEHFMAFVPVVVEGATVGILALFQEADRSPAVYQGTTELLNVIGDLAADVHRNYNLARLTAVNELRGQFDKFTCDLLRDLDLDRLVHIIANDGRGLIGCDRVTVLTTKRKRSVVRAISGVDSIERRSSAVRVIEALTRQVMKGNAAIWSDNATDATSRYFEDAQADTGAAFIGIIPLTSASPTNHQRRRVVHDGAIVVETFGEAHGDVAIERIKQRADAVAERSCGALASAVRANAMPFSRLARWWSAFSFGQAVKWFVVLAILASVIIASLQCTTDFEIDARGELQPQQQEFLYAPSDGVVVGFPSFDEDEWRETSGKQRVSTGDIVVQLQSSALDYELTKVLGEQATANQELNTITVTLAQLGRSQDANNKLRFDELTAKKLELEVVQKSLDNRLQLLRNEQQKLSLTAGIDGVIETRDVISRLQARPVRQGQQLVAISNPAGQWRVDLYVPDKHIGYILKARQEHDEPLTATFLQKANPEIVASGVVERVAMSTEIVEEYGACVLVTLRVDDVSQFQELRPGTSVAAKIHCGRRSVAYTWLYDVIESARTWLML